MTMLYLYYNQPEAIAYLESLGYPEYDLDIIFVDDGSKEPLKLDWPNAKVLRIEEDTPWNMSVANNLGFRNVAGKVFRSDIDHYITKDQVQQLKDINVGKGEVVLFNRKLTDGREVRQVHNIFMINTDDYWAAGGYDEQFAGNYGYEDTDQKMRFKKMKYKYIHSELTVKTDLRFSTKGLDRDTSINYAKLNKKWDR